MGRSSGCNKLITKLWKKVAGEQLTFHQYLSILLIGTFLFYSSLYQQDSSTTNTDIHSSSEALALPSGSRVPLSLVMDSYHRQSMRQPLAPYLTPALVPLASEDLRRRRSALQSLSQLSMTTSAQYYPLFWGSNATINTSATLSVSRRHLQSSLMDHLHVILRNCDAQIMTPVAVFCPVLGVASTSLLQALASGTNRCSKPLSMFSIRDREHLLRSPSTPRILFIREPVSRVVSLHHRLMTAGPSSQFYISVMAVLRGESLPPSARHLSVISLPFLIALLSHSHVSLPAELIPVTQWCQPSFVHYDHIVRLENLHDQLAQLSSTLQLDSIYLPSASNRSTTNQQQAVPKRTVSKIQRFYIEDLRLFHAAS